MVRLTVEFERYLCFCTYEEREIPKKARFWWDRQRGAWVTTSARVASRLLRYADREAGERILDKLNGRGGDQLEYTPAKVGKFGNHA